MQHTPKTRRSACTDQEPQLITWKPDFAIGSDVMVKWRQRDEYLANVLAYRERGLDRREYQVKYVWDGVIEWAHASRVRLASEDEVSAVMKFIEESKKDAMKNESTDDSSRKSKSSAAKGDSSPSETSVARGDMLYDRNIAQFTDNCRKRRMKMRGSSPSSESLPKVPRVEAPNPSPVPATKAGSSNNSNRSNQTREEMKSEVVPESVTPAVDTPSEKLSPATFPCPYCSRNLRRERLLETHIKNYHLKAPSPSPSPISQLASSQKKIRLKSESESLESQNTNASFYPEHYVFCSSCKFSGSSFEAVDNLIQCKVCLVWAHRQCYDHITAESWTCPTCRRPNHRSGFVQWAEDAASDEEVGPSVVSAAGDMPTPTSSVVRLRKEMVSLLNWLSCLQRVAACGRRTVCRIRRQGESTRVEAEGRLKSLTTTPHHEVPTAADLVMDFPFIPVSQADHLGALESTELARIFECLERNAPEDLPDLMAFPEDLLPSAPPSTLAPSLPPTLPVSPHQQSAATNVLMDTPTKNLLANFEQVLDQTTAAGAIFRLPFSAPTATTIEADLQRAVLPPPDGSSGLFGGSSAISTPDKSLRAATTTANNNRSGSGSGRATATSMEMEAAAASLINFFPPAPQPRDTPPVSSVASTSESFIMATASGNNHQVSDELEAFNTEILVPLEQMMGLIESRLSYLEAQVAKLQLENGNGHNINNGRGSDAGEAREGENGGDDEDDAALSARDGSVSRSPTDLSSHSPSPNVYPTPIFAPKRSSSHQDNPNARRNPF